MLSYLLPLRTAGSTARLPQGSARPTKIKAAIMLRKAPMLSRFARNTLDCLKYIRQLKDKNIPVFFEKEAINTMDAKGEVLITIMASLAQQES